MKNATFYHYTNSSSFFGIVDSKCLFASHHSVLNDKSEVDFCREIIKSEFGLIYSSEEMCGIRKFLEGLSEVMDDKFNSLNAFIFSMSRKGDNLSQWYAYGDSCMGFSLGFSLSDDIIVYDLDDVVNPEREISLSDPFKRPFAVTVKYVDNDLEQSIRGYIQSAYRKFKSAIYKAIESESNLFNSLYIMVADEITRSLIITMICSKNYHFAFEEEVRIIYLVEAGSEGSYTTSDLQDEICFRISNDKLVPYVKIELDQLLKLMSVTIGPLNSSAKIHVRNFIGKHFDNVIDIRHSHIPMQR